jgi:hypothetical protein
MTSTTANAPADGTALFTVVTCVTATCSRCHATPESEDLGYTPHFDSPEQAREQLTDEEDGYGWRIIPGPDGSQELLCQTCASKDQCARLGHDLHSIPAGRMPDGRVLGAATWCDRCGELLSHEPAILAPSGYPAREPAILSVRWDAAALPDGQLIAAGAARLLASLSDDAVAARWDAWNGAQDGRPQPHAYAGDSDPAADLAAARALMKAARQLMKAR